MKTLISATAALGLLLLFAGLSEREDPGKPWRLVAALDRLAAEAGIGRVGGSGLLALSLLGALAGSAVAAVLTSLPVVVAASFLAGGLLPIVHARSRREKHRNALRHAWPDAMAEIISGVRAGLSLAECCSALAGRGPRELRAGFAAFSTTYEASGSFAAALIRLQDVLEDPVADRVAAILRMAHEVGGNDLVRVLRTSAELIREDLRIRGEISARWSWTITAARLAAGAPFVVLVIMSVRPEAAGAYASRGGTATIIAGALASLAGYRLMLRAAKLPEERRIR